MRVSPLHTILQENAQETAILTQFYVYTCFLLCKLTLHLEINGEDALIQENGLNQNGVFIEIKSSPRSKLIYGGGLMTDLRVKGVLKNAKDKIILFVLLDEFKPGKTFTEMPQSSFTEDYAWLSSLTNKGIWKYIRAKKFFKPVNVRCAHASLTKHFH